MSGKLIGLVILFLVTSCYLFQQDTDPHPKAMFQTLAPVRQSVSSELTEDYPAIEYPNGWIPNE